MEGETSTTILLILQSWSVTPLSASPPLPPLVPPFYAPRTHAAGGCLGGQRTRPGNPAGSPGPEWVGGVLGMLPPDPPIQKGPSLSVPSHLPRSMPLGPSSRKGLWKVEDPSRLPGAQVGGGNARCASPDPLVLEGPPSTVRLSSSSPPSSLSPMPLSPTWPKGAPER